MVSAVARARLLNLLEGFVEDVTRWDWDEQDPRANCATHARSLRAVMNQAVDALRARTTAVAQPDPGDSVRALRDIERELGVLRAVWAQLRDKIDARLSKETGALLRAADEIVWSIHRAAMARVRNGTEPPVPLVSVGPEWGAEMVPIPRVDLATRGTAATAAAAVLEKLAIREIRLPWAVIEEPWLLALMLHEIGHAIEFDLVPDGKLLPAFSASFSQAVGGPRAHLWRDWADEIFADACAVAAAGPAILPVLVAWETTATARLASSAAMPQRYPPPVVRWHLVRAWSRHLGLPAGHLPPIAETLVLDSGLRALVDELPAVVTALDQPLPIVERRIGELWPDTVVMLGDAVTQKQEDLAAGRPFSDSSLEGARAALVAAVQAGVAGPGAAGSYAGWREDLCTRVLAAMAACHGPGTRGEGHVAPPAPAADLLIAFAGAAREEADRA